MILWRQALTYIKIVSTVTYISFLNLTACWYFLFLQYPLGHGCLLVSWSTRHHNFHGLCGESFRLSLCDGNLWALADGNWLGLIRNLLIFCRDYNNFQCSKWIKNTHEKIGYVVFFCISSLTFCLWDSKINWEFYNVPINLGLFFFLKAHWTSTGSWPHPKRRVGSFSCKLLGSQEAMKKVSL